jgi:O-antigen/teichoic acid export membrane protein
MTAPATTPRRVAVSTAVLLGGQLLAFAARFALALVLARTLGTRGFGAYALALSIASVLTSVSLLGLNVGALRTVALEEDADERAATAIRCVGIAGGVAAVLALTAWAAPDLIVVWSDRPQVHAVIAIAAAAVVPTVAVIVLSQVALGVGRPGLTALANVVPMVLKLAVLATLAVAGVLTVDDAVAVHALSLLVGFVLVARLLHRQLPLRRGLQALRRHDGHHPLRALFAFSLPVYATQVLGTATSEAGVLMVGAWIGLGAVGALAVALRLATLGRIFNSALLDSTRPLMARAHHAGDRAALGRLYATTTRWSATVNLLPAIITIVCAGPLLDAFGVTRSGTVTALVLLTVAAWIQSATGPCGALITMIGRPGINAVNSAGSLAASVVLGVALIPMWGITGAAVTALAVTIGVNVVRLFQAHHLTGLQPFTPAFVKTAVAGVSGLVIGVVVVLVAPGGAVAAAVAGCLALGVYVGVLILLGIDTDDRALMRQARVRITGSRA